MKCATSLCLVLAATLLLWAAAAADPPATPEASATPLAERVETLERETVVLREDLGKARLDAKADLEELARRQAEAIARLNQQIADTEAKLQAERAAREREHRRLWMAVGALAVIWLVAGD